MMSDTRLDSQSPHPTDVVHRAYAERTGPDAALWEQRVKEYLPRIHDTLGQLVDKGETEEALRLASELGYFWANLGHVDEGRTWLERVIAMPQANQHPGLLSAALFHAGTLAFRQRDQTAAYMLTQRSIDVAREAGDKEREAYGLIGMARVCLRDENHEGVQSYGRQGLLLMQEVGNKAGEAGAWHMMAYSLDMQHRFEEALAMYKRSMTLHRETGNQVGVWAEHLNTGLLELRRGNLERGKELLQECWRLTAEDDTVALAYVFVAVAVLATIKEEQHNAATLFGAADAHLEPSGLMLDPGTQMTRDMFTPRVVEHLGQEEFRALAKRGREMPRDELRTRVEEVLMSGKG